MIVQPYILFDGRCEEAIAFYTEAIGARLVFLTRFADAPPNPERPTPPDWADNVMHATLAIGDTQLMMSDGGCMATSHGYNGFSLSLHDDDAAVAKQRFDALAAGGKVTMPFQETFWSTGFGMATDRFDVPWMVSGPMKAL